MNVSGASTGFFGVPTRTTQASQPSSSTAPSQFPLLSNAQVLSSVQTTFPNGKGLAISRVSIGAGDLGASQTVATDEDKREDAQMLSALKQMAQYFGYSPSAAQIRLQGTAAIDLSA
jgi:hypothetical protein